MLTLSSRKRRKYSIRRKGRLHVRGRTDTGHQKKSNCRCCHRYLGSGYERSLRCTGMSRAFIEFSVCSDSGYSIPIATNLIVVGVWYLLKMALIPSARSCKLKMPINFSQYLIVRTFQAFSISCSQWWSHRRFAKAIRAPCISACSSAYGDRSSFLLSRIGFSSSDDVYVGPRFWKAHHSPVFRRWSLLD